MMQTGDFDYHLPAERIAQSPAEPRDASRLLALRRGNDGEGGGGGQVEHRSFRDLTDYLRPGDLMVFNRSRVIPARLRGVETGSGARVEILLTRRLEPGVWQALGRPGRRLRAGAVVIIGDGDGDGDRDRDGEAAVARIAAVHGDGLRTVHIADETALQGVGELPLPPYIKAAPADPERYQTVYADVPGSVAAPTAGLHFTDALLEDIRRAGVATAWVTLHIGLDTFRPVRGEDIGAHKIHTEWFELPAATAEAVNAAREAGRRIIAVGTTTVRTLEQVGQDAAAAGVSRISAAAGDADLFIRPGHAFRLVDAMVTNFHLPRSTLLMLVSAFAGRERVLAAYEEAIAEGYRFYSFGDAMLII